MLDSLTDPFAQGIGQRALLELMLLGTVCGPLGVWIVLYRQSYAAESIAHAALPGLVLASLAGLPLLLGAAGGLVVAATTIAIVVARAPIDADAAVAVTVTTLFGAGALLALSPELPANLGSLLFGDPLSVSAADLVASATLAGVIAATLALSHRRLALACFDRVSARNLGAAPQRSELILLAALAATTLIAVQALGNLLVVALVVAPGAAALRVANRLPTALALSAALGIGAGIGGLYVSHYLNLAAGASIALVAVATFALTAALARSPTGSARRRPRSVIEAGSPVG